MQLGDILRKERERKKITAADMAARLGLSLEAYNEFESGASPIEEWGPRLPQIAIKLSIPTSRLISETGKSAQALLTNGQCGRLVTTHREKRRLSQEELAALLGWSIDQLASIEGGDSPLEAYAPLLLRFAETINQPIFNLFYPCGLPFDTLQDYP
jgi:transcriptional regulator with XRE-family HTH domain